LCFVCVSAFEDVNVEMDGIKVVMLQSVQT
jgi:hypothetical protein